MKMMTKKMNSLLKLKRKSRAISPLISTVLLIAIVVIGGVIVGTVLFASLSAPTPVEIQITEVINYGSRDEGTVFDPIDGEIDEFTIIIQNTGRNTVIFPTNNLYVLNNTDLISSNPIIPSWSANFDSTIVSIAGYNSIRIQMVCSSDNRELSVGDRIIIRINGTSPENPPNGYKVKTFESIPFTVKDISGPLEILNVESLSSLSFVSVTSISIEIQVKNWGSLPIDVTVELFIDSTKLSTNTSTTTSTILNQQTENFMLYLDKVNVGDTGETIATIRVKTSTTVYALIPIVVDLST